MKIKGIHHISSIVWHAQENLDFYSGVLGYRLLKRAVNFDAPEIHHLYFGHPKLEHDTVLTFFPWKKSYKEGMIGNGQVTLTALKIPYGSIQFWVNRFKQFNIPYDLIHDNDGSSVYFNDPHGIKYKLVEDETLMVDNETVFDINPTESIQSVHSVVLHSNKFIESVSFFKDTLKLQVIKEDIDFIRFHSGKSYNQYIDIVNDSIGISKMGAGTVHHLALSVDKEDMNQFISVIQTLGLPLSEEKNRNFFHSVYFREPGGILIELATDEPGFPKDEVLEVEPALYLPPFLEHLRLKLEKELMPLWIKPVHELRSYPYEDYQTYQIWKSHQDLLSRINYFAKLSKERKLTLEETEERDQLRRKYVENITGQVRHNLNNVQIETEDGQKVSLKLKERKKHA